jgi:predicted alpha/beta superfamily hydrolase
MATGLGIIVPGVIKSAFIAMQPSIAKTARFLTLLCLMLLAFSGPGFAKDPGSLTDGSSATEIPLSAMHGLGDLSYFQLDRPNADGTTHPYHILISVPDTATHGAGPWPTIYLLDGGTNFPMLVAYHRFLQITDVLPLMIIVGISYGTDNFEDGNNRSTDFTAPSQEREHYGGAAAFDAFLAEQLMPEVQERYAVDPARQTLFGQSLGGQFGLFVAMYGKAPFAAVIASNPALHRNLEFFLAGGSPRDPAADQPRLFVAGGSLDDARFREPALAWMAHWQPIAAKPWRLATRTLEGHTHFSAGPEAFRSGLLWLFGDDGGP